MNDGCFSWLIWIYIAKLNERASIEKQQQKWYKTKTVICFHWWYESQLNFRTCVKITWTPWIERKKDTLTQHIESQRAENTFSLKWYTMLFMFLNVLSILVVFLIFFLAVFIFVFSRRFRVGKKRAFDSYAISCINLNMFI